MEIKGQITHVLDPITGSGANGDWKKQTFVLQTEGQYPKSIAFDVFNDKIAAPKKGQNVTVGINLESREYEERWFTNAGAWTCKVNEVQNNVQNNVQDAVQPAPKIDIDDRNDLPF